MKTKKNTSTKPETVAAKPETIKKSKIVKAEKPAKVAKVAKVKAEKLAVVMTATSEELNQFRDDASSLTFDTVPKGNVAHIKQLFNLINTAWPKNRSIPFDLKFTAEYTDGTCRKLYIVNDENVVQAVVIGRAKNLYDFITFDDGSDNIALERKSWSKEIRPLVIAQLAKFAPKVVEVAKIAKTKVAKTKTAEVVEVEPSDADVAAMTAAAEMDIPPVQ